MNRMERTSAAQLVKMMQGRLRRIFANRDNDGEDQENESE